MALLSDKCFVLFSEFSMPQEALISRLIRYISSHCMNSGCPQPACTTLHLRADAAFTQRYGPAQPSSAQLRLNHRHSYEDVISTAFRDIAEHKSHNSFKGMLGSSREKRAKKHSESTTSEASRNDRQYLEVPTAASRRRGESSSRPESPANDEVNGKFRDYCDTNTNK